MITSQFVSHDIETEVDDLKSLGAADIIYSDPPWGQSNLRYWRTMNKQNQSVDWKLFIHNFVSLTTLTKRDVFIETSVRELDTVVETIENFNGKIVGVWRILYGSPKRPNQLIRAFYPEHGYQPEALPYSMDGLGGVTLVKKALSPVVRENDVIFDPCVGLGTTIRACKSLSLPLHIIANDLNPERLARSKELLTCQS